MQELTTSNTQIVIDEKGIIKSDPEEVIWMSYEQDSKFSDLHDDIGKALKEFGVGSREHVMARAHLASQIQKWRNKKYDISPKIFFTHVKASLLPIECAHVDARMRNIKKLAEYCELVGQEGSREAYLKLLIGCAKESEIYAAGLNLWINESAIINFTPFVRDSATQTPVAMLKKLRDFPRILPKDVQKKLEEVRKKEIFDDFMVLYLDYTKNKDATESTKTKREKDPILFGTIKELPDRLYFITYWEDEHCDLTIEQLVDAVTEGEYDFIQDAGEVTKDYLVKIQKELKERESQKNWIFKKQKEPILKKIMFWR